jgi:hypothetical protein
MSMCVECRDITLGVTYSRWQRRVNELLQDPGLFPDKESERVGTKFVITALKFSLVPLHLAACLHKAYRLWVRMRTEEYCTAAAYRRH